ncbi:MAG: hypothetical protein ACKN9T_16305 [Candidatus Methylumidiphilus sp.]
MSSIPQAYLDTLTPLVDLAREFLEEGQSLHPVAFVGNFSTGVTIPVLFDTSSSEAKDGSSMGIRLAAVEVDADFVAMVMEAWSLPENMASRYQAILERYGSIAASPYRVDIVTVTVETRHGLWLAQMPIKPKGQSKKRRTFGQPNFRLFTEAEGRFVNLLPPRDNGLGVADKPGLH